VRSLVKTSSAPQNATWIQDIDIFIF